MSQVVTLQYHLFYLEFTVYHQLVLTLFEVHYGVTHLEVSLVPHLSLALGLERLESLLVLLQLSLESVYHLESLILIVGVADGSGACGLDRLLLCREEREHLAREEGDYHFLASAHELPDHHTSDTLSYLAGMQDVILEGGDSFQDLEGPRLPGNREESLGVHGHDDHRVIG